MSGSLWCRGAINAHTIRAENLPAAQRKRLQKEGYVVEGVGEPVPSVVALTVLGPSWPICHLVRFSVERGSAGPMPTPLSSRAILCGAASIQPPSDGERRSRASFRWPDRTDA